MSNYMLLKEKNKIFIVSGNVLFSCKRNHSRVCLDGKFLSNRVFPKTLRRGRRCFSTEIGASISSPDGTENEPGVLADDVLVGSRLIYAVASAMGHNQVKLAVPTHIIFMKFIGQFKGDSLVFVHISRNDVYK